LAILYNLINLAFQVLNIAIFARVLLSWVKVDPYHPAVQVLYQITDPIIEPLRRVIPPIGMIDISPMVAMVLLEIVRSVVMSLLYSISY
jgi:YggT family protein